MLSYKDFTPAERQSIVKVLEKRRDELDALINTVSVDSFEFLITPAEARRLAGLVRPYYMFIAHRLEDHPGFEPAKGVDE